MLLKLELVDGGAQERLALMIGIDEDRLDKGGDGASMSCTEVGVDDAEMVCEVVGEVLALPGVRVSWAATSVIGK